MPAPEGRLQEQEDSDRCNSGDDQRLLLRGLKLDTFTQKLEVIFEGEINPGDTILNISRYSTI